MKNISNPLLTIIILIWLVGFGLAFWHSVGGFFAVLLLLNPISFVVLLGLCVLGLWRKNKKKYYTTLLAIILGYIFSILVGVLGGKFASDIVINQRVGIIENELKPALLEYYQDNGAFPAQLEEISPTHAKVIDYFPQKEGFDILLQDYRFGRCYSYRFMGEDGWVQCKNSW